MGFVTGFTGGVTLTLSAAYLLTLQHQRNREHQSSILRAQSLAIADLIDPVHPPLPPSRSELAAIEREHSLEAVKDRWNTEVENAVRWVQRTDWDDVRETAEAAASKFFGKALSEEGKEPLSSLEQVALSSAQHSEGVSEKARQAYEQAKQKEKQAEAALSRKASEVKSEAKKEASEAKGWFSSAVDKGRDIVNTATVTTGLADVELTTDGATPAVGVTPVQKALQQRYQRPEAKHNKTVADALKERYMPVDKRDNTVLRGV